MKIERLKIQTSAVLREKERNHFPSSSFCSFSSLFFFFPSSKGEKEEEQEYEEREREKEEEKKKKATTTTVTSYGSGLRLGSLDR